MLVLRCINLEPLMTEMGQQRLLPRCNIYGRLASLSRHKIARCPALRGSMACLGEAQIYSQDRADRTIGE
jgi:hypothetical protein